MPLIILDKRTLNTISLMKSSKLSLKKKIIFSAIAIFLIVLSVESGLRLAGIRIELTPIRVLGKHANAFWEAWLNSWVHIATVELDPVLRWRVNPDNLAINKLGFRGREITQAKPPSITRIACLGCSCTFYGVEPYPELLDQALNWNLPQKRFEVINAGIVGYTSHQGLLNYKKRLTDLDIDVVTVFFGWNDHWISSGKPDHLQYFSNPVVTTFRNLMRELLSYKLLIKTMSKAYRRARPFAFNEESVRVPIKRYRNNLLTIGKVAREQNSRVIYITAPPGFHYDDDSSLESMNYLIKHKSIVSLRSLVSLHRNYNNTVREVAAQNQAHLVDLEAKVLDEFPNDYFLKDKVHLSLEGRYMVSQELARTLRDMAIINDDDYQRVLEFRDWVGDLPTTREEQINYLERKIAAGLSCRDAEYWLAWLYFDQGAYADSVQSLAMIAENNITFPFYYNLLGQAHFQLGDLNAAVRNIQKAIALDPNECEHYIEYGMMMYRQKRFKEAKEILEKNYSNCPDNWVINCDLGYTNKELGELWKAFDYFERWYQLEPKKFEPLKMMVEICIEKKDKDYAEKYLVEARENFPDEVQLSALETKFADVTDWD